MDTRKKREKLTHDVLGDVTASRFEESELSSNVGTRDDTRSSDESCTNVGNDGTVQVRHDHNIELLRSVDKLHRGVVDTVERRLR